jgi:excisionase family DNA binding protein
MDSEHVQVKREVSTSEASILSGLSQGYITSLLRQGKLDGRREGSQWLVDRDALERYLGTDAPIDRQYRYAWHLVLRAQRACQQGTPTEAASLYLEAIARYDQWPPLSVYEGALARNNLASLYLKEHRYSEAEALLKEALTTTEQHADHYHSLLVAVLMHLVAVYTHQERFAEAEIGVRRLLEIREQELDAPPAEQARLQVTLAQLLLKQNRYTEAETLLKHRLSLAEQHFGPHHPAILANVHALIQLYTAQGKDADMLPLLQRSVAFLEQVLGPEHPLMASILERIGQAYETQALYEQAEACYKRALLLAEQGADQATVADLLSNLAMYFLQRGNAVEAEPLLERLVPLAEQLPDVVYTEDVVTMLTVLSTSYSEQGQNSEAEPLMKHVLTIAEAEQELGLDPLAVATILSDLALLCLLQGKEAEGLTFSQRALEIRAKGLGLDPTDPLVLFKHALEQGGAASSDVLKSRRRTVD